MSENTTDYAWYELRAIYAQDYASGKTIEQLFELTAPSDYGKQQLKDIVADDTGRMMHDIEELHVIASSDRDQVDTTSVHRKGRIQMSG